MILVAGEPSTPDMGTKTRAYVAIGSNIEPERQIPRCLRLLGEMRRSALVAVSSRYRTLPWGVEDQLEFMNLVVGLDTYLGAHELLLETKAIEARLNRVRTFKNGPRTIDLDILLFGNLVLETVDLTIPHPGLLERDFMLEPLIEIAPEVVHPVRGLPLSQLQEHILYRQIIRRIVSTG